MYREIKWIKHYSLEVGSQGLLSQVGRNILVVKVTFEQRSDKSIRLCGHIEEGHTRQWSYTCKGHGAVHAWRTHSTAKRPTWPRKETSKDSWSRDHSRKSLAVFKEEEASTYRNQDTKPLPRTGLVLRHCFSVTSELDLLIWGWKNVTNTTGGHVEGWGLGWAGVSLKSTHTTLMCTKVYCPAQSIIGNYWNL